MGATMHSLLAPGYWWVRCPSDPRWDANGRANVGLFGKPDAVVHHLAATEAHLGIPPPADCEWGYEKE
jgi:hypothetical protein